MNPPLPNDEGSLKGTCDWPHAPPHRLSEAGVYFVTARTVERRRFFHTPERLDIVRNALLHLTMHYGWRLEAWAVMANHYHFVAHAPGDASSLVKLLRHFHGDVSRAVNALDAVVGRKLWQNYRDTHLTYQHSYLARLAYTHQNAVHHRLAGRACDYPWCSAGAFERTCTSAWSQTIYSFPYDQIAVSDEDHD